MEEIIKAYLDQFAAKDKVFAEFYRGTSKTVEGCADWIAAYYEDEARKHAGQLRKVSVIADTEHICKLAVLYFETDEIRERKPSWMVGQKLVDADYLPEGAVKIKVSKPAIIKANPAVVKVQEQPKAVQLELF